MPITCSQGLGAAERIPPGGWIPVMEMEAELNEGIEMKMETEQIESCLRWGLDGARHKIKMEVKWKVMKLRQRNFEGEN